MHSGTMDRVQQVLGRHLHPRRRRGRGRGPAEAVGQRRHRLPPRVRLGSRGRKTPGRWQDLLRAGDGVGASGAVPGGGSAKTASPAIVPMPRAGLGRRRGTARSAVGAVGASGDRWARGAAPRAGSTCAASRWRKGFKGRPAAQRRPAAFFPWADAHSSRNNKAAGRRPPLTLRAFGCAARRPSPPGPPSRPRQARSETTGDFPWRPSAPS
jgi:hypothetical protein